MELSNDKLKVSLDRTSRALASDTTLHLEKTVTLGDFESRGFRRQTVSTVLGIWSFTNEETGEGYVAQQVANDNYRIKGHWVPGNEEVIQSGYVLGGHRADYVRVANPSQRPQLRVFVSEDTAAA